MKTLKRILLLVGVKVVEIGIAFLFVMFILWAINTKFIWVIILAIGGLIFTPSIIDTWNWVKRKIP